MLGLDTIRPNYLFMYHDPLDQFVKDVGRQLSDAGVFPDEGQELFDILVDLITLRNLCCQLLPLPLEGGLLPFVIWSHGLIPFLADFLQCSILIELVQDLGQLANTLVHPFQLPLVSVDLRLLLLRVERDQHLHVILC